MGASMPLQGAAAWVPQTQAQLTPAATPNGGAMPQAIAYPTMQQFQVSPQVNLYKYSFFKLFF
jgi:hypothetical protein